MYQPITTNPVDQHHSILIWTPGYTIFEHLENLLQSSYKKSLDYCPSHETTV